MNDDDVARLLGRLLRLRPIVTEHDLLLLGASPLQVDRLFAKLERKQKRPDSSLLSYAHSGGDS